MEETEQRDLTETKSFLNLGLLLLRPYFIICTESTKDVMVLPDLIMSFYVHFLSDINARTGSCSAWSNPESSEEEAGER